MLPNDVEYPYHFQMSGSSSSINLNQSTGPIRQHKSRIDTSPYRSGGDVGNFFAADDVDE
jgi:hypothetical protein